MAKKLRLDKYLSETLGVTRSEARQLLKKGQISVDGATQKDGSVKIDPDENQIVANGKSCVYEEFHYYMLHKPAGVVSAVTDAQDTTVIDLLNEKNKKLFPVGRLDKDTEGLLLITDDGELSHRLLSPKKHVDKCYLAKLTDEISEQDIEAFARGIDIGEKNKTMPAKLERAPGENMVYITIQEGKFHQVKRMAHSIGKEVLYLKRLSMGSLVLDEQLEKGQYRPLTKEELERLQEQL